MAAKDVNALIATARDRCGIPQQVHFSPSETILDQIDHAVGSYADRIAFTCLGHSITYRELDRYSRQLAAYFQHCTPLKPGDRLAVQLVNVIQYPITILAALRAGLVLVNTNPLYTEREMLHQFNDSGAKGLVILANMASKAESILPQTGIESLIVTELGDMLPWPKRSVVNTAVKYLKKLVPSYHLPQAMGFRQALAAGSTHNYTRVFPKQEDLAVLQYTGGTTGVAKGAMLSHKNLVANMHQSIWLFEHFDGHEQFNAVCPLPLYHIYAFTVHCLVGMRIGFNNILIPNPRDLDSFAKAMKGWEIHGFTGLNTLFVGLCQTQSFRQLDFSHLRLTLSGGMALTEFAANSWEKVTGCRVAEGYGLTETSPIVSGNPPGYQQLGTIGVAWPDTELKIINEQGKALPPGQPGELCVRGPQVMQGYWQRPEESAEVLSEDGWLRTGDIALIQEDGYARIVDRAKDMILVSGFNVYPNELEDVLLHHPAVIECAAVGVPDDRTGETVKMFVVTDGQPLSAEEVRQYMRKHLTSYKVPKQVEFCDELPKSNVGKILRRELRE